MEIKKKMRAAPCVTNHTSRYLQKPNGSAHSHIKNHEDFFFYKPGIMFSAVINDM